MGLIMKDSGTNLRGEVPKKVIFVCDSCCGQTVDLDREEGAGGSTTARSLSCACSFAMSLSARSLPRSGERERGRAMSKKRQKRSAQVDVLCLFFFAPLQDVGLLETSCFSSMVSSISGTSSERFLTITFRISSVKYGVYFLVVCLFFPRSRIDFQKKLDEKHKKQTSCPNFAQFTNFTKICRFTVCLTVWVRAVHMQNRAVRRSARGRLDAPHEIHRRRSTSANRHTLVVQAHRHRMPRLRRRLSVHVLPVVEPKLGGVVRKPLDKRPSDDNVVSFTEKSVDGVFLPIRRG